MLRRAQAWGILRVAGGFEAPGCQVRPGCPHNSCRLPPCRLGKPKTWANLLPLNLSSMTATLTNNVDWGNKCKLRNLGCLCVNEEFPAAVLILSPFPYSFSISFDKFPQVSRSWSTECIKPKHFHHKYHCFCLYNLRLLMLAWSLLVLAPPMKSDSDVRLGAGQA